MKRLGTTFMVIALSGACSFAGHARKPSPSTPQNTVTSPAEPSHTQWCANHVDEPDALCFDFSQGLHDWKPDYTHYSALDESQVEFSHGLVGENDDVSLELSGTNPSTEQPGLMLFIRRQVQLEKNQVYKVIFHVNAILDFSQDCVTPFILRGGASETEPTPAVNGDYYMGTTVTNDPAVADMHISTGGTVMAPCTTREATEAEKSLTVQQSFEHLDLLVPDAEGRSWVFLGFEAATAHPIKVKLRGVRVELLPMARPEGLNRASLEMKYNFNAGLEGWTHGFADLPPNQERFYELDAGLRPLPGELNVSGQGYFLKGNNHSDDLMMYLQRKLTTADGIVPNRTYRLTYEVEFASNAPSHCFGVGGAEGESVTLKLGGSNEAPTLTPDHGNIMRLNWDLGQQTMGGKAGSSAGHIANGVPCEKLAPNERPYRLVQRKHTHVYTVKSSAAGELWLYAGVDSGFEATTALFFNRINVTLKAID